MSSEVGTRSPVDPNDARAKVDSARAAVDNPEAAGEAKLRGVADEHASDASVNVQVEGSVGKPPPRK